MELLPEEKGWIASYVREHNLEMVNKVDITVTPKHTFYTKVIKRGLDIAISSVAIVATLPVNLVIGICTYFDVGKPIFFIQKRPGKDGKLFPIIKFRNMRNAVDEKGYWLPISERVTKFGAFMRKTSLDELLNFYSILIGDMSIIGPRPLADLYLKRYSNRHMMRHAVRPGLECPNIRNHGYSIGWNEQFENDIWYVENVSFPVDCKEVVTLFKMVFDRKTRKEHAVVGPGDFLGYDTDGKAFGANNVPEKYIDLLKAYKEAERVTS